MVNKICQRCREQRPVESTGQARCLRNDANGHFKPEMIADSDASTDVNDGKSGITLVELGVGRRVCA